MIRSSSWATFVLLLYNSFTCKTRWWNTQFKKQPSRWPLTARRTPRVHDNLTVLVSEDFFFFCVGNGRYGVGAAFIKLIPYLPPLLLTPQFCGLNTKLCARSPNPASSVNTLATVAKLNRFFCEVRSIIFFFFWRTANVVLASTCGHLEAVLPVVLNSCTITCMLIAIGKQFCSS